MNRRPNNNRKYFTNSCLRSANTRSTNHSNRPSGIGYKPSHASSQQSDDQRNNNNNNNNHTGAGPAMNGSNIQRNWSIYGRGATDNRHSNGQAPRYIPTRIFRSNNRPGEIMTNANVNANHDRQQFQAAIPITKTTERDPSPDLDPQEQEDERITNEIKDKINLLEDTVNNGNGNRLKDDDYEPIEGHFLSLILEWPFDWIRDPAYDDAIPDRVAGPWKILRPADSYQLTSSYCATYLPLLVNELWSQLYNECKARVFPEDRPLTQLIVKKCKADKGATGSFIECFLEYEGTHCCTKCLTEKLMTDINCPKEGALVRCFGKQAGLQHDFFGYVARIKREGFRLNFDIKISAQNAKMIRFYMSPNSSMRVEQLHYIKPNMRHLSNVVRIMSNPLVDVILRPEMNNFQWDFSPNRYPNVQRIVSRITDNKSNKLRYNATQREAIVGCLNMILNPNRNFKKLQLIQGPPGTGKTHILMALVKGIYMGAAPDQLLSSGDQQQPDVVEDSWNDLSASRSDDDDEEIEWPRILITAPSNGAVDEIARRLILSIPEIEGLVKGFNLRIVRSGYEPNIYPDVAPYTLHSQASSALLLALDGIISKLSAWLDKTPRELKGSEDLGLSDDEKELEKIISAKLKELRNQPNSKLEYQQQLEELRRIINDKDFHGLVGPSLRFLARQVHSIYCKEIMQQSHIVLCTLNSTQDHLLKPLKFDFLIMDEACQCSEPESLMPFFYGIRRAILIGDPLQLPATIISRKAGDFGYNQSLFERLYNIFNDNKNREELNFDLISFDENSSASRAERNSQRTALVMLKTQYRMHPQICAYPSKTFYKSDLSSWDRLVRQSPLVPYLVFDLEHSRERRTVGSMSTENRIEAAFVIQLVETICKLIESDSARFEMIKTLGIITSYKGQRALLSAMLENLAALKEAPLTVDLQTVDGFQGQERDLMISSFVRAPEEEASADYIPIGEAARTVSPFARSSQRLNVALTRARYASFVVINNHKLGQEPIYERLLLDARRRNVLRTLTADASDEVLKSYMLQIYDAIPADEIPVELQDLAPLPNPLAPIKAAVY